MKNRFLTTVMAGCLVAMVAGCSSTDGLHNAYVSPRIEGHVIDADTKLPIERVLVLRQRRSLDAGLDEYVTAGEIQQREHTIYTNADGEFDMPSRTDLEMGSDRTWSAVTLKFIHPGYHMYSTNYVNHGGFVEGEPLLQAGDIELRPVPMPASGSR
jgi:hypothetical protein